MSATAKTFEITEQYVAQRFPEVVERIRTEHRPLRRRTAVRWLREALRFLDACATAERPISPSKRVDKAWHEFILHTELYTAWCDQRYGRYIHHTPWSEPDADAYERAYSMLTSRHGPLDKRIWPDPRRTRVPYGGAAAGGCGAVGTDASCGGGGGGCGGGGGS